MSRSKIIGYGILGGILLAGVVLMVSPPSQASLTKTFQQYCQDKYEGGEECPKSICRERIVTTSVGEELTLCLPKDCLEISAKDCPQDYCALMTNCSNEQVCHYQMQGERAQCGDLAYAGQDVECCEGLIRRCGIEFLDGTCDMEGRNSIYSLPICIPCGDGFCNNFENRCNCPEDCGDPLVK